MSSAENSSLALIVRRSPYQQRSSRLDLDVALAAAVMDFKVEVYFVGVALLQLIKTRDPAPALLPAGYRAWGSLPDLGDVAVFAENHWLAQFPEPDFSLVLPVTGIETVQMKAAWRRCDYSMVL